MQGERSNLGAMVWGLAAFRSFCGLLLMAMPWIVGNGLDGYGATVIGLGVAIVAAATQMHRAPWLRWVQLALTMAVFFTPYLFSADDISDRQVYYAVPVAFMLLVSSIVTPEVFAQTTSERTSASDSAKSEASKSSNVNTPPN